MQNNCPILGPRCYICDCSGRACKSRFLGLKVEWPELRGVSALEAKRKIESDNPHVTAIIIPLDVIYLPAISCCNRVILYVPSDNCPNGPVLKHPIVG